MRVVPRAQQLQRGLGRLCRFQGTSQAVGVPFTEPGLWLSFRENFSSWGVALAERLGQNCLKVLSHFDLKASNEAVLGGRTWKLIYRMSLRGHSSPPLGTRWVWGEGMTQTLLSIPQAHSCGHCCPQA